MYVKSLQMLHCWQNISKNDSFEIERNVWTVFQTEGNAEMLTVFIDNKDGEISQVLWQLNDAIENDEQKWMEGRVKIQVSNVDVYQVKIISSIFF